MQGLGGRKMKNFESNPNYKISLLHDFRKGSCAGQSFNAFKPWQAALSGFFLTVFAFGTVLIGM